MDTRVYSFVAIPWSDSKWCYSSGYIDRSRVTRLGAEAADDGSIMSFSKNTIYATNPIFEITQQRNVILI